MMNDYSDYYLYGGSIVMGIPNSWLVYFSENPSLKWMMSGCNPIDGNLYIFYMEFMGKNGSFLQFFPHQHLLPWGKKKNTKNKFSCTHEPKDTSEGWVHRRTSVVWGAAIFWLISYSCDPIFPIPLLFKIIEVPVNSPE